MVLASNKDDEE